MGAVTSTYQSLAIAPPSTVSLMVATDAFAANYMFLLVNSGRSPPLYTCPCLGPTHHAFIELQAHAGQQCSRRMADGSNAKA
jgi:hypothetical protein